MSIDAKEHINALAFKLRHDIRSKLREIGGALVKNQDYERDKLLDIVDKLDAVSQAFKEGMLTLDALHESLAVPEDSNEHKS